MGPRLGGLLASLLLLAALSAPGRAPAASPVVPSCSEGPIAVAGTIRGTPCADLIVAPPGVERVEGGGGDDTILAAPLAGSASCPDGCRLGIGSQTFDGGPGDDIVYGERGNDILNGGEGNDQLFGGIGDDLLRGGPGNDRLSGGFGADSVDGEAGDDYVRGDGTADTILDSGGGSDTLSYATGVTPGFTNNGAAGYPSFPAASGERGVSLNLNTNVGDDGVAPFGGGVDSVAGGDFERVIGTPYSDYIVGSAVGETIDGGGGGDVILGEGGDDILRGGVDGDHLDGGSGVNSLNGGPGSDHCQSPAGGTSCEPANAGGVVLRDPTKISVGLMAPGTPGYSQLYLTDSNGADEITATYAPGPPAAVTFALGPGSTASFDQSASASGGCGAPVSSQVLCTLSTPLDSVVIAGMGGDDTLGANGFPTSISVVISGGEGGDSLTGGALSEDVLVDGPDLNGDGNDVLSALGGDDALLNNGAADQLFGGEGNDLFLSNSICDGDVLNGGSGRDNASWAKFKASVEARIGVGDAGRPGPGGAPECSGGSFDSLQETEDLEGTASADVFHGGAGPNQLLGHLGPDTYFAGAGADVILANSGDADPTIDCGDDADTALVDHLEFGDATPVGCESVQEADPNSFRVQTQLPPPAPVPPVTPPPSSSNGVPPPSSTHPAHLGSKVKTVGQFARLPRRERRQFAIRFMTTHPVDPCTRARTPLGRKRARKAAGIVVRSLRPGALVDGRHVQARTPIGTAIRRLLAARGC